MNHSHLPLPSLAVLQTVLFERRRQRRFTWQWACVWMLSAMVVATGVTPNALARRHQRRHYNTVPVAQAFVAHPVKATTASTHAAAASGGGTKSHAKAHVAVTPSSHGKSNGIKPSHVAAAALGGAAAAHVVATAAHANIYTPPEKGHSHDPAAAHTPPVVQPVLPAATPPSGLDTSLAASGMPDSHAASSLTGGPEAHLSSEEHHPAALMNGPAVVVDETKQSLHDAIHNDDSSATAATKGLEPGLVGDAPLSNAPLPWQQMVVALLAVLALAWVILKGILPKVVSPSGGPLSGLGAVAPGVSPPSLPPFKVLSSLSMGPGQWLRMVQVGPEVLLISQTATQIQLLKVCEQPSPPVAVTNAQQVSQNGKGGDSTNPRFVTLTSQADISELAYEEVRVQGYPDHLT